MSKDDFLNHISNKLSMFTRNEDRWSFDKEIPMRQGVVYVNGQKVSQGPQGTNKLHIEVNYLNDGWIQDADDESTRIPFGQIEFVIKENNNTKLHMEECIYYDDTEYINSLFNKFFGI